MDTDTSSSKAGETTNQPQRYLRRSSTNTIIGGVAGGIGEYFAIDPTVVRLGFVMLAFVNGLGLLLYLVLAIIMPAGGSEAGESGQDRIQKNIDELGKTISAQAKRLQSDEVQSWWGWILVGLGLIFIVINFDILSLLQLQVYWPILLILLGLVVISRR